jgi:hypothetical protein
MHSPSLPAKSVPRKGPRPQPIAKVNVSPLLARLIEQRVAELHADGEQTEYSRVLAREFRVPEATIDRIVAALMLRHRAEAATLRVGVAGALDEAARAAKQVWEEVA